MKKLSTPAPLSLTEALAEKANVLAATRESNLSAAAYHQERALVATATADEADAHEAAVTKAAAILVAAGVTL